MDAQDRVEAELFDDCIGTLDDHVQRKAALADPTRYAILYHMHDAGEVTIEDLDAVVGDDVDVEQYVSELIGAGLVSRTVTPGPVEEDSVYVTTFIGRRVIETDIELIQGRE